jgi:hypothetical protein
MHGTLGAKIAIPVDQCFQLLTSSPESIDAFYLAVSAAFPARARFLESGNVNAQDHVPG